MNGTYMLGTASGTGPRSTNGYEPRSRGCRGRRGDRQSELFYDIYSTHADLMRRAYRATHSYVYMVWDGRRWLQPVGGQWVRV